MVDLGDDLEGFVPKTDLGLPEEPAVEEQVQLGQHVALTIVEVDPIHHRVLLSAREFLETVEPPAPAPMLDSTEAEDAVARAEPRAEGGSRDDDTAASKATVPATEEQPTSAEAPSEPDVEDGAPGGAPTASEATVPAKEEQSASTDADAAPSEVEVEPENAEAATATKAKETAE